jgi:hypothetical protein
MIKREWYLNNSLIRSYRIAIKLPPLVTNSKLTLVTSSLGVHKVNHASSKNININTDEEKTLYEHV